MPQVLRRVPNDGIFWHLTREECLVLTNFLDNSAKALLKSARVSANERDFTDDIISYLYLRGEKSSENPKGVEYKGFVPLMRLCFMAVSSRIKEYIRSENKRWPFGSAVPSVDALFPYEPDYPAVAKNPEELLIEKSAPAAYDGDGTSRAIRAADLIEALKANLDGATRERLMANYIPAASRPEMFRSPKKSGRIRLSPSRVEVVMGIKENTVSKDLRKMREVLEEHARKEGLKPTLLGLIFDEEQ